MRHLIWFAVVFLCLFYSVSWIVSNPALDFPAFYSAGRLLREGKQPYNLHDQCEIQSLYPSREGCLPFAHPPLLLSVMAITAIDNFYVARILYGSFVWILFLVCVWPLKRLTGSWTKTAVLFTFLPVLQTLQATQSSSLLLLFVLLWIVLLEKKKDFWAGAVLALTLVKPHFTLALGIPLLFARPKAFLGLACGGMAVAIYSFALVGADGIRGMLAITQIMASGHFVRRDLMYSFIGTLTRSGFNAGLMWPVYGLGILVISVLWRRLGTSLPMLSAGIVIALFVSPHLHMHDLCLLIVPMIMLPIWAPLLATTLMAALLGSPFLYVYTNMLLAGLGGWSIFAHQRSTAPQSMNAAPVLEAS